MTEGFSSPTQARLAFDLSPRWNAVVVLALREAAPAGEGCAR